MAENQKRVQLARTFRKNLVPAERLLWRALRNRALGGFKFRRLHPVGGYVVDFACVECKVVVEVDGESHLSIKRKDAARTNYLESNGWYVLRYWNTEVYEELETVREAIYHQCVREIKNASADSETEKD